MDKQKKAIESFIHFFKVLFEAADLTWRSDNAMEIEIAVQNIIDVAQQHEPSTEQNAVTVPTADFQLNLLQQTAAQQARTIFELRQDLTEANDVAAEENRKWSNTCQEQRDKIIELDRLYNEGAMIMMRMLEDSEKLEKERDELRKLLRQFYDVVIKSSGKQGIIDVLVLDEPEMGDKIIAVLGLDAPQDVRLAGK